MMKTFLITVALATLVTAQAGLAQTAAPNPSFVAAADVVFEDIIPGVVAFATMDGDRNTGPHGTFVRIPAGQATPLHTHGSAYSAVIIQGNFENPIEGDDASNVVLTAGSFYHVPAGAKHVTRCAADSPVDCMSFFYQDVPFDFAVAE